MIRNNFSKSLALFDFADPSLVTGSGRRPRCPSQALYLLNSPFVIRKAEAAADRLLAEADGACDCEQIRRAYLAGLRPAPNGAGRIDGRGVPGDACPVTERRSGEGRHARKAAWAAFYQALFASADFLYRS